MLTAPRLMDFEAFAAVRKPRLDGFLKAHLEQRAVVLHNLSLQQRRMVKFVELRDLSQTSPALLLRSGRPVFKRLKTFFSILQDCYPELVHQVLFFNAPAGAARLVAMLSSILNARMMAKIRLLPVAQAYTEMTWRLNAMAISSWMEQVSKAVDLNTMRLARGTEEYAARWLAKGQTLRWTVTVREKDVRFQYVFIEENCGARELEPLRMEETAVVAGAPLRGSLVAPGGGVFWARVSNAFSWLESKQCALLLE
ncbi:unnamed protein product [Prorocentrum cordatum]|uniref:CRAL-TRIO domain-containing protein n=1 Tax=Prorocentrum cordatum TaxID=2364126 RepID=A0ABN9Q9B4_9DINO|nr:unnamed protein product [Polarella glacialis]